MLNISLELEAPHVARFKRAKKYASQLCGITKSGLQNQDIKDIHDLYSSLQVVTARLQAEISRRAKNV